MNSYKNLYFSLANSLFAKGKRQDIKHAQNKGIKLVNCFCQLFFSEVAFSATHFEFQLFLAYTDVGSPNLMKLGIFRATERIQRPRG